MGLIGPVAAAVFIRAGEDRRAVDGHADRVAPPIGLEVNRDAHLQRGLHRADEALNLQFTRNPALAQRNQTGQLLVDDLIALSGETTLKITKAVRGNPIQNTPN